MRLKQKAVVETSWYLGQIGFRPSETHILGFGSVDVLFLFLVGAGLAPPVSSKVSACITVLLVVILNLVFFAG